MCGEFMTARVPALLQAGKKSRNTVIAYQMKTFFICTYVYYNPTFDMKKNIKKKTNIIRKTIHLAGPV